MNTRNIVITLILAACCLLAVPPVMAQGSDDQTMLYQTSFASEPGWRTNTGGASSNYYWVPDSGVYHFSIEPSSGGYSYIPVSLDSGSFTLDYDLFLTRIDEGATFRMGLSGSEMDPSKGPSVISMFTNAKYGQIMWLHFVSLGNKLVEVNSQSAAVEMGPDAYKGATAKYEINKPYHVTVNYDDETKVLSMKVRSLQSGSDLWSYFIQCGENLRGLDRIYIGAKGDYGSQNIFAQGYIDNVRLTVPSAGTVVTEMPGNAKPVTTVSVPVTPTKKPTPKQTVPTPYPTGTPQSPSSGILPLAALSICGVICYFTATKKN
ncbi:MAG: hypothetical protein Q7T80_13835 [Methanoregula sp.]|nr:hypothetical protein [Methanoregula sp.]